MDRPRMDGFRAGDRLISYLPLSHIAEQVVSHLLSLATGACVHFAGSLEQLPADLREVERRPLRIRVAYVRARQ